MVTARFQCSELGEIISRRNYRYVETDICFVSVPFIVSNPKIQFLGDVFLVVLPQYLHLF